MVDLWAEYLVGNLAVSKVCLTVALKVRLMADNSAEHLVYMRVGYWVVRSVHQLAGSMDSSWAEHWVVSLELLLVALMAVVLVGLMVVRLVGLLVDMSEPERAGNLAESMVYWMAVLRVVDLADHWAAL